MSRFYINSESTEDTYDFAENLDDAIRKAREAARGGEAGELICIEHEGRNIRQFVRTLDGKVTEEVLF
jgi:hypothetical protein